MRTEKHNEVARQVESMETLAAVIRWATARTPRAEFVNVVVQDEYTHDVVVRIAADLFAVFDTTWLGAVMAVAIWDHEPSAGELLERRLANGWKPTASAMRDGEEILGYAACLVGRVI